MESTGKRFLIRRRDLTTRKLFVEFYLPESQALIETLRRGAYEVRPLREIAKRVFDGPFGSDRTVDMYQDSGIPYIRVKDVLPGMIARDDLTYISPEKHQLLSRCRVVPGNVLLTIAGRLGTAAVFPEDLIEGNITGHIVGIEPNDTVNSHYLALYLNSRFGDSQFTRWGHRTTRPELNLGEVSEILVAVPPLDVQDQIAQMMQDAYAVRRAKLAEAEQMFAGIEAYVFDELGLDQAKLQSRRTALKPVSTIAGGRFDFEAVVTSAAVQFNHVEPVELGRVVQLINDRVIPSEDFRGKDVNYVGLANIAPHTGELADFSPAKGESILSSSVSFRRGDILFGRMRPYLNKVWVAEFDGICSGEALVLRPDKSRVDTAFLHALLLSRITLSHVIPRQSGTSLPRVVASDVLRTTLPIPSDMEQQVRIGAEALRRRTEAKQLRAEAEALVTQAKANVERMILGEENVL